MKDFLSIEVELKVVKICDVDCRNPECKKIVKAGNKFWAYHARFGPPNDPNYNNQGCICLGCAETIDDVKDLYLKVLTEKVHNRTLSLKNRQQL